MTSIVANFPYAMCSRTFVRIALLRVNDMNTLVQFLADFCCVK